MSVSAELARLLHVMIDNPWSTLGFVFVGIIVIRMAFDR